MIRKQLYLVYLVLLCLATVGVRSVYAQLEAIQITETSIVDRDFFGCIDFIDYILPGGPPEGSSIHGIGPGTGPNTEWAYDYNPGILCVTGLDVATWELPNGDFNVKVAEIVDSEGNLLFDVVMDVGFYIYAMTPCGGVDSIEVFQPWPADANGNLPVSVTSFLIEPPCVPAGHEFVGWTDVWPTLPDGSYETIPGLEGASPEGMVGALALLNIVDPGPPELWVSPKNGVAPWPNSAFLFPLFDPPLFDEPIPIPIDVSTYSATQVTQTTARLKGGLVNDGGLPCEARFRYWIKGHQAGTEQTTPWQSVVKNQIFSELIFNLSPDTTYSFVAEARNSVGSDLGDERTFKTLQALEQVNLSLSSTAVGSVIEPGEGDFIYIPGTTVPVRAEAVSTAKFVGWSGTAVDAGNVADPNAPNTTILMDDNYTLEAQFQSQLDTLYVDDTSETPPPTVFSFGVLSASDSPRSTLSTPEADGSEVNPLNSIQGAIEVAKSHATIRVAEGTYFETLDLLGKDLHLDGLSAINDDISALPAVDARGLGTVITCEQGENANCLISGFVLTGGFGELSGAVACLNSSPVFEHCLMVGNRFTDPNGGAVYLQDSNSVFINCTIADNLGLLGRAGVLLQDSHPIIQNSILWDTIALLGLSDPMITYSTVAGGWAGEGNLSDDPLFVTSGHWQDINDPNSAYLGSDHHLMSTAGRWDPETGTWVTDNATSPAIDAGDPVTDWSLESEPNGGRVNQGAYGGTSQASRSEN